MKMQWRKTSLKTRKRLEIKARLFVTDELGLGVLPAMGSTDLGMELAALVLDGGQETKPAAIKK